MKSRAWRIRITFPFTFLALAAIIRGQDPGADRLGTAGRGVSGKQSPETLQSVRERTQSLIERIRTASYRDLLDTQIETGTFESASDFFRTRVRLRDFFLRRRLRFSIEVNSRVYSLQPPEEGLNAIIAHELSHVVDLKAGNRLRLLGMVRLLSRAFVATFERRTDLEAISRGYGQGLKDYRLWLYRNVPQRNLAEKQRNYLSPEEIDAILSRSRRCPRLLDHWFGKPPRNLQEIQSPIALTN